MAAFAENGTPTVTIAAMNAKAPALIILRDSFMHVNGAPPGTSREMCA